MLCTQYSTFSGLNCVLSQHSVITIYSHVFQSIYQGTGPESGNYGTKCHYDLSLAFLSCSTMLFPI